MKTIKCSIALFAIFFFHGLLNGQPCKSEKLIVNDSLFSYLLNNADLSVECVYKTPYRQVLLKKNESFFIIEYSRGEDKKLKKSLGKELCIDSSLLNIVSKIYLILCSQEKKPESIIATESGIMIITLQKKNCIRRFQLLKSYDEISNDVESIRSYIAAQLIIPNILNSNQP